MNPRKRNVVKTLALVIVQPLICFAQFSPGNVVVLQAGTGTGSISNTGNPVILREFSSSGTPMFSVAVPSSSPNPLIIAGSALSEGALSRSVDKKLLVFAGYAQALPNSTNLGGSTASAINRAVGAADINGVFTRTVHPTFFTGGSPRGATSDGGGNFWASGSGNGINYFGTNFPAITVQNNITNTRAIQIAGNGLYFSTGSGTTGIYKVGSGLPHTSGQTNSLIIATGASGPSESPFAFCFNDDFSVCYIADDRSVANGGGIQKWVYSQNTWTLAYTLGTGTGATSGARGVVADFNGPIPVVYATSSETSVNRLIRISDNGPASPATTIAVAPASTIFRGVALSPCETPLLTLIALNQTLCASESLTMNVTATGGSGFTYSWTGAGITGTNSNAGIVVNAPVTGDYAVTVKNLCGSSSAVVSVSVTSLPSLSISASSSSVCFGQSVTLAGVGASSYLWSGGITNAQSFSPAASSVYTLLGSDNGCVVSSTVQITVEPLPHLIVPAINVCPGNPGTLTASGAQSYSWSTGATGPLSVVSPTANTVYTVMGQSSAGCVSTATAQAVVSVTPVISLPSATICAGKQATLTATGIDSFTWTSGASISSIVVSPTVTTVYGVQGELTGCSAVASASTQVVIFPLPILVVTGDTALCSGLSATMIASGGVVFLWQNSLGTVGTGALLAVTPSVTTVYTLTGTNANGCESKLIRTVTVADYPVLLPDPVSAEICEGDVVTLSVTGAISYSWAGSGMGNSITVHPAQTTIYTVTGTGSLNCSASLQISVGVNECTGPEDHHPGADSVTFVYPNPSSGIFYLSGNFAEIGEVSVYNTLGDCVFRRRTGSSVLSYCIPVDQKGMYLMVIQFEKTSKVIRLIVE